MKKSVDQQTIVSDPNARVALTVIKAADDGCFFIGSSEKGQGDAGPSYENIYRQLNLGLENTQSRYVLWFGGDDVMNPGMIQQLYEKAETEHAAIVYCNYELMTADERHQQYVYLNSSYNWEAHCQHPHYPDVCLIRRKVLQEMCGWDVSRGRYAMWWLWLQIGRHYGSQIYHVPFCGFRYRIHDGGMHFKAHPDERAKFMKFVDKWSKDAK